jgi:hypothetical protein
MLKVKTKQNSMVVVVPALFGLALCCGLAFVFLLEAPNVPAKAGSFSGAAIASQALKELSETTTQETTRDTVKEILKRRGKPLEELTDNQKKLITLLETKLHLNEFQSRAALEIMGEKDVPPERLAAMLAEIADKFKALQSDVAAQHEDDSVTADLRNQIEHSISAGDLGRADDLLATLATVERLAPALPQRKGLEGLAQTGAPTIARRGEVALIRLQYLDSARHFADAAQSASLSRMNTLSSALAI